MTDLGRENAEGYDLVPIYRTAHEGWRRYYEIQIQRDSTRSDLVAMQQWADNIRNRALSAFVTNHDHRGHSGLWSECQDSICAADQAVIVNRPPRRQEEDSGEEAQAAK